MRESRCSSKAPGICVEGTGLGVRELGPGCVLRASSSSALTPIVLHGTGPGARTATIPISIQMTATGTLTFQVFVRAPSPGCIGTFTNAVQVTLP